MMIEKRRYQRYSVPDLKIQVFCLSAKIIGKLVNICKEGLSFQFNPKPDDKIECSEVKIMAIGSTRFHLPAISCKTVYDISVLAENQTFTGSETRLRGVQFSRLTREQNQKLSLLLEHHKVERTGTIQ